jgi:protoheme IX farnesyltransferase
LTPLEASAAPAVQQRSSSPVAAAAGESRLAPATSRANPLNTRERINAFIELTKPGITRLVLITTAAGFYLASNGSLDWAALVNVLIGTALAASGTNALNQWAERDADARMRRTAARPLPSGRLGSAEALLFSAGIAVAGLLYLLAFVNVPTTLIVGLSLTSYVFVYTPLKRITWTSTLIGAVPGALPILAGWTGAGAPIDLRGSALFLIMFAWQMPHFYALAWIYREDYRRGGFRMLTVIDPSGRRAARQAVGYAAAVLGFSLLPTVLGLTSAAYLIGALALGVVFLGLSIQQLAACTDRGAWRLFMGSVVYLPLLLAFMVVDRAL